MNANLTGGIVVNRHFSRYHLSVCAGKLVEQDQVGYISLSNSIMTHLMSNRSSITLIANRKRVRRSAWR